MFFTSDFMETRTRMPEPNKTFERLTKRIEGYGDVQKRAIRAKITTASGELALLALADESKRVLEEVSKNVHTKAGALDILAHRLMESKNRDNHSNIIMNIINNPNVQSSTLVLLSSYEDDKVKTAIMNSERTPHHTKRKLAEMLREEENPGFFMGLLRRGMGFAAGD